ncbi:cupin domain-containing protein [Bhargavaea beijingensis]|uniref:Cupin domain-containing protein n=1 Tax=Bhargavaea beijingensis TaxID=426756 RepID=A0A1G7A1W9_9BACL|nr:cupin domain-containing protein [Bhargavaea beijingensis]MCW1927237.1 cupin domain-containing protein [Bhargavaea beijingensis]RSK35630.1 cupin domain-containing protein [Bhargavaea beijingensis]SDE08055.1 Cupin domain-containing protein [Bhargavaea beijingensis]
MEVLKLADLIEEGNESYSMKTVFQESVGDAGVKVGRVVIRTGEKVPLTGVSKHAENEYSIILKGSLVTEVGGEKIRVSAGDATFIPKGEEHIATNDGEEDCELVFVLVG